MGFRTVEIGLPAELIDYLRQVGDDMDATAADAVRFGMDPTLRPPEPSGPASDPDPARRRRQAADALLHYSGRYWYLALLVARLAREVADLEQELALLEQANAD